MQTEYKLEIDLLDKKVDVISDLLAKLSNEDDLRRLVMEWRRPGWTTPAEFLLVSSALDSFGRQLSGLNEMKADLMKGVQAVGR